jgi:hypothetical protein
LGVHALVNYCDWQLPPIARKDTTFTCCKLPNPWPEPLAPALAVPLAVVPLPVRLPVADEPVVVSTPALPLAVGDEVVPEVEPVPDVAVPDVAVPDVGVPDVPVPAVPL